MLAIKVLKLKGEIMDDIRYMRDGKIRFTYTRLNNQENDFTLFIYNSNTGNDYVFNNTTALIWELIDQPKTIIQICDKISAYDFETKFEDLIIDVTKILNIFINHGLAIIDSQVNK